MIKLLTGIKLRTGLKLKSQYTTIQTVDTPTIYMDANIMYLDCTTVGAVIRYEYAVSGPANDVSKQSNLYTSPVVIDIFITDKTINIKCIGYKDGMLDSLQEERSILYGEN